MPDVPEEPGVEWLSNEDDLPDVEGASSRAAGTARRVRTTVHRPMPLLVLVAFGLLVASVLAIANKGGHSNAHPSAHKPLVVSSNPSGISVPATPVTQQFVMPRLPGMARKWSLFAKTPDGLVRIAFARGTSTLTPAAVTSTTQLVVSGGFAYLHSSGKTVVVDPYGMPTRVGGWLADSSRLFPDEDDHAVWGVTSSAVGLVQVGSSEPYASFDLPAATAIGDAAPLGDGDIAVPGVGGTYGVGGSHALRRITTGRLLATGESFVVAQQCNSSYACSVFRVGTAPPTAPHRIPGTFARAANGDAEGTVSPDGRLVAIELTDSDGDTSLHLVNLASGRDDDTHIAAAAPTEGNEVAVWSPDARYLWTITSAGALEVVDSRTGVVTPESIGLRLRGPASALASAAG